MNHISILSLFSFLLLSQCYTQNDRNDSYTFPSHYSLQEMKSIDLPTKLEEISGLEWINGNELWAIEDESSVIYSLNPKTGEIMNEQKFAKNADIEDILYDDGKAWVLQSNGNIFQVDNPFTESSKSTLHEFTGKGTNDFESIIKSNKEPVLWIFCKTCRTDKNSDVSSVFAFDLSTRKFENDATKILKNDQLKSILKEKDVEKIRLQPSAIAFHPIELQYYLLSSTDHWLMVLDQELAPKEFYNLNPTIFKQPEGITFSPDGTLFISNEARGGRPTLLIFPYKP